MTTDPKALIERFPEIARAFREAARRARPHPANPHKVDAGAVSRFVDTDCALAAHCLDEADQALRDLTAENAGMERTIKRLNREAGEARERYVECLAEVARLKALGDGLAEAMRLSEQLFGSAALAAWETREPAGAHRSDADV